MMREVYLREDDPIFRTWVTNSLHKKYQKNKHMLETMLLDQGDQYWIQFCSTLKRVLEKEGYHIRMVLTSDYFSEFFIKLLESICFRPVQIWDLLEKIENIALFSGPQGNSSLSIFFKNRCEDKSNTKFWVVRPLILRAAGSLLKVFDLWLVAPPVLNIEWNMPDNWLEDNDPTVDRDFEEYFIEAFPSLLGLPDGTDPESIVWLKKLKSSKRLADIYTNAKSKLRKSIMKKVLSNMTPAQAKKSEEGGILFAELSDNSGYNFLHDCLRGYDLYLGGFQRVFTYYILWHRELYISSTTEIFHPFSQFLIAFWYSAFGPKFWSIVTEKQKQALCKTNSVALIEHKWYKLIGAFTTIRVLDAIRAVIYAESRYNDLTIDTTWWSEETVVRLLWNMPFCLNWLQVLLLRIYEFETNFLPFIHFPVHNRVKLLVEHIYLKYCKQARFLTKAAMIVADYIVAEEKQSPGRCYEERMTMKFAISALVPIMQFLSGPAYQVLEVVASESYYVNGDSGEVLVNDGCVVPDLKTSSCVPGIDGIFNSNHRCINYWLNFNGDQRTVTGSRMHIKEAVRALQSYEKTIRESDTFESISEPLYSYDRGMCAVVYLKREGFKNVTPLKRAAEFISQSFELLQEDGWISSDIQEEIFFKNFAGDGRSLNMMLHCHPQEQGDSIIWELESLGLMYFTCACLLGDTSQVKVPEQSLLSMILSAECRSAMSDVASRFIMTVANRSDLMPKPCPTKQLFRRIMNEIKSRHVEKIELEDAHNLVFEMKQFYYVDDVTSLPPLEVLDLKNYSEHTIESLSLFLKDLKDVRCRLLHEISEKQLEKSASSLEKNGSCKNILFNEAHIIEYRFVEEMASLQHCLSLGEDHKDTAIQLAKLLSLRFKWIVTEFQKWNESSNISIESKVDCEQFLPEFAEIRVQATVLLIHLHSIYTAYFRKIKFWPVSNCTAEFCDFSMGEVIEYFMKSGSNSLNSEDMTEFLSTCKTMIVQYLDKMLDHTIEALRVPNICSDINQEAELYSLSHAQNIYTFLLHSSMLCLYNILSCRNTLAEGSKCIKILSPLLVAAGSYLLEAEINPSVNWNETGSIVKCLFKNIYFIITHNLILKDGSFRWPLPSWKGFSSHNYNIIFPIFYKEKKNIVNIQEFFKKDFGIKFDKNSITTLDGKIIDCVVLSCACIRDGSGASKEDKSLPEKPALTSELSEEEKMKIKRKAKNARHRVNKKNKAKQLDNVRVSSKDEEEEEASENPVNRGGGSQNIEHGNSAEVVTRDTNDVGINDTSKSNAVKNSENSGKRENIRGGLGASKDDKSLPEKPAPASELSEEEKLKIKRKEKNARHRMNKKNKAKQLDNVRVSSKDEEGGASVSQVGGSQNIEHGNGAEVVTRDTNDVGINNTSKSNAVENSENSAKRDCNSVKVMRGRVCKNYDRNPNLETSSENSTDKTEKKKACDEKKSEVKSSSSNDIEKKPKAEKNLKKCFECGIVEPEPHTYKKCLLCAKQMWKVKRFYCSQDCQAKAWKNIHRKEHYQNKEPAADNLCGLVDSQ